MNLIHSLKHFNLSHIPSSSKVLKTKWFLSDKLVIGAPDKKSRIPDLYCPAILWENMCASFWNNVHFKIQPHLSNNSLMAYFKYTYDSNKWSKFGSFNPQGSSP